MISALIITKDAYERVKFLTELLDFYVDEIVIIHSAPVNNPINSLRQYPKVLVYYSEPKGYVEAYYDLGINSCTHDWIFLLDDDEIPCRELLQWLFVLSDIEYPAVYDINRHEPNGSICRVPRLFHKDAVEITGLIHRGIEPVMKPFRLHPEFYLTHSSQALLDKSERFAKIEVQQYPEIIGHIAKKHKSIQYLYFFISSIPRILFAPNRKDLLIYLEFMWKELRK